MSGLAKVIFILPKLFSDENNNSLQLSGAGNVSKEDIKEKTMTKSRGWKILQDNRSKIADVYDPEESEDDLYFKFSVLNSNLLIYCNQ